MNDIDGIGDHARRMVAETKRKDVRPDPQQRITLYLADLIRADSYGVEGSTFYTCRVCDGESAAGLLNKGIQHESNCPVGKWWGRQEKKHGQ